MTHSKRKQLLEPIAYRINDAVQVSGLSRSKLYQLISTGSLASIKVAGRRLILAAALHAFMGLRDDGSA